VQKRKAIFWNRTTAAPGIYTTLRVGYEGTGGPQGLGNPVISVQDFWEGEP